MKNEVLFFDTSALLKRFLNEEGSKQVTSLFEKVKVIVVSPITHIECVSTFKRLLHTHEIDSQTFHHLCDEIAIDFSSYITVKLDDDLKQVALHTLEKYPLKAADTIQLASLIHIQSEIDSFVVCDEQLKKYALKEGFKIIDPLS